MPKSENCLIIALTVQLNIDSTCDKQDSCTLLFPVRYFKQIAKSVRANGSASSGSEENADDFLGCINIPLNVSVQKFKSSKQTLTRQRCRAPVTNQTQPQIDSPEGCDVKDFPGSMSVSLIWLVSFSQEIPAVGYDTWFKLEPRSSTSKVQGECHLILKLFTSQVCTV